MMKKVFSVFIFLILFSCSEDDTENLKELPLIVQNLSGTWQLNGSKISSGGPLPDKFTTIENGEIFLFELDMTYELRNGLNQNLISAGEFTITNNDLVLTPNQGDMIEPYSFYVDVINDSEIIWSPAGSVICIEGCLYRYIKLE